MEYDEADRIDSAHSTSDLPELGQNIEDRSAQVEYHEPSGPTTLSLSSPDHATIVSSNSDDKTYGFDTGGIAAFLVEERRPENEIIDALAVVPEYQVIEKTKGKKRRYLFGGISLAIILILIIAVVVTTVKRRDNRQITIASSQAPSASTSALLTTTTTTETQILPSAKLNSTIRSQYDEIVEFDSVFSSKTSPQFLAAAWLEESGGADMGDIRIINRFALATFYFATNGDKWTKCGRQSTNCVQSQEWLTAENECDWYGIQCNGSQIIGIHILANNRERHIGIIGTLPFELSFLSNLTTFIIPSKAHLKPNVEFPDWGKGISGPFPDWSKLSTLKFLYMNNHQLEGPFPTYLLEKNSELDTIEFKNNSFQGQLFQDLSAVKSTALQSIRVNGNNFTGPILPQINKLSTLKNLDISMNGFTGTLPDELLTLINLTTLDLSNNMLTGTLNSGFENLINLRTLKIHSNDLSGSVPEALCDRRDDKSGALQKLTVDCMGDPAKVSCMCCTNCPLSA